MKIAVGLSGGVDSAVSALLLKRQGHKVVGVFMKNWSDDYGLVGDCPWEDDQQDAIAVAKHIGIDFLTYNFELTYREKVIKYFFNEYKIGRTPNPDILCNSEIKFDVFLNKVRRELGVDKVATGHYARLDYDENGRFYKLLRGIDTTKDQSYFLCKLNQEQLSSVIFPVGHLTKQEVREIALKEKLPNANKKDSQGICFIGKIDVREFIKSNLGENTGDIVNDDTGAVLGKHSGVWFYTNGQRDGLGLGGGPWFVIGKDKAKNILYVVRGKANPKLFYNEVRITNLNIINKNFHSFISSNRFQASIRYRQEPQQCSIELLNADPNAEDAKYIENSGVITDVKSRDKEELKYEKNDQQIKITFNEPARAPSPGQFACIYKDSEEIVASGVII